MKLRIRSNTLRFRLGQVEVSSLAKEGFVEEQTQLGPNAEDVFIYRIESSSDVERLGLRYQPGRIRVLIAKSLAGGWSDSDEVGFEGNVEVGGGECVSLLVEKDFACLKPRDLKEDEGAFPHPEAGIQC